MSSPTDISVSVPIELVEPLINALIREARLNSDPRIDTIVATMKDILTMSNTISQQVDAAAAANEAAVAKMQTDLTAIAAELKAIGVSTGATITQAQADRTTAVAAKITAAVTAMDALVTKPVVNPGTTVPTPPVAVVFNAADLTPNAAGGRNTSHLPNFDATLPETA